MYYFFVVYIKFNVSYLTPLDKDVLSSSDKISSVEARLVLRGHKLPLGGQLVSVLHGAYGIFLCQRTENNWLWIQRLSLEAFFSELIIVACISGSEQYRVKVQGWLHRGCVLSTAQQRTRSQILGRGPHLVVQLVGHGRFGSCGPFSTFSEVFLDQRSVGPVLKEAGSPGHWSLNDLIPNNQEDVPGHGWVQACRSSTENDKTEPSIDWTSFVSLSLNLIYYD